MIALLLLLFVGCFSTASIIVFASIGDAEKPLSGDAGTFKILWTILNNATFSKRRMPRTHPNFQKYRMEYRALVWAIILQMIYSVVFAWGAKNNIVNVVLHSGRLKILCR